MVKVGIIGGSGLDNPELLQNFQEIEVETKFNMRIHEVHEGKFFENEDFLLESMPMQHQVPCVGFAFVEKDRRRIKVDYVKKLPNRS